MDFARVYLNLAGRAATEQESRYYKHQAERAEARAKNSLDRDNGGGEDGVAKSRGRAGGSHAHLP